MYRPNSPLVINLTPASTERRLCFAKVIDLTPTMKACINLISTSNRPKPYFETMYRPNSLLVINLTPPSTEKHSGLPERRLCFASLMERDHPPLGGERGRIGDPHPPPCRVSDPTLSSFRSNAAEFLIQSATEFPIQPTEFLIRRVSDPRPSF